MGSIWLGSPNANATERASERSKAGNLKQRMDTLSQKIGSNHLVNENANLAAAHHEQSLSLLLAATMSERSQPLPEPLLLHQSTPTTTLPQFSECFSLPPIRGPVFNNQAIEIGYQQPNENLKNAYNLECSTFFYTQGEMDSNFLYTPLTELSILDFDLPAPSDPQSVAIGGESFEVNIVRLGYLHSKHIEVGCTHPICT